MAATLPGGHVHGHLQASPEQSRRVRDAGRLHTKRARELAEYARSEIPLEASIGLATINSLLDVDEDQAVEINAVDVLIEHGRGKNVVLVGHFPFIPRLQPAVGRLWVLEQHPTGGDHPAAAAAELIPQAEVVAITSSALVNHTMDELLGLCRPGSLVMALGPSTPLSRVLFGHGISILSGTKVLDEAALLRTISQGASFKQAEGVRLLTLVKNQSL